MYKCLLVSLFLFFLLGCHNSTTKSHVQDELQLEYAENELSVADNYAKQIILSCGESELQNIDSLIARIVDFHPGGLSFSKWPIESIQNLAITLDSLMELKPLFFSNYFELLDLNPYPIWGANKSFQDSMYWRPFLAAGINSVAIPETVYTDITSLEYLQKVKSATGLVSSYQIILQNKSPKHLKKIATTLQKKDGILWIDSLKIDSIPYHKIKKALNWKGLLIANPVNNHLSHLHAGADMVVISDIFGTNGKKFKQRKSSIYSYSAITEMQLKSIKKNHFGQSAKAFLKSTKLHFLASSAAIFNDTKKLLPLKKIKIISLSSFFKQKKQSKIQLVRIPNKVADSVFQKLNQSDNITKALFVFSNPNQYSFLKKIPNLIFSPNTNLKQNSALRAQLVGSLSINGDLMLENKVRKGKRTTGKGIQALPAEFAFIDSEMLETINSYVVEAIDGKAFPGCQVLAIKDNVLIYNKSFGHTTYDKKDVVNKQHVYDLASLTKVLSTTLVAMKLWEDGYFKLEDKLANFLPDSLKEYLPNGSTLRNITFQELLTHKSGLPAGFPVIDYMRKAADLENRFSNGFCDYPYDAFQTEVANDLYLENVYQDSMWITMNSLWIDTSKSYRYSDVNMNLLYFIFRSLISTKELNKNLDRNAFEEYLNVNFYKPLGMSTTQYLPLKKLPANRIVPTENDRFWRKQLLQGHVHDPNAALYGGIAGNAGLFSNASDLGILLNMWQNGGVFNGERYLKAETIKKFSEAQPGTHRGLGFNKRTFTNSATAMASSADPSSYGHTGFTGTCFWVDPVSKISYVFLSNRVHPRVTNNIYQFNIRTRVHQVFYDAMLK